MAKEEGFFEGPVDRTPYGDFGWIVAIVGTYLCVGGFLLFQLGSLVKQSTLFHIHLPTISSDNAPSSDFLQQVKDSANQATKKAADKGSQQASEAIKNEADKQVKEQTEAAKQQAADQIKAAIPTP